MGVAKEIPFTNISSDSSMFLSLAVNPQARQDLWIVADADSSDKMFRFHQIKELSKTEKHYGNWYIFRNFDVFSHTSTATALQLTQIINAVIAMLNSYRRLPAILLIVMSENLMHDKLLSAHDLRAALRTLCRTIIQTVESWIDGLPLRAKPIQKTQIYITKPLPKPSSYLRSKPELIAKFASIRKEFNTALVDVVREFGIGFVNTTINQEDGVFFKSTTNPTKFALSQKGLDAYWTGLNNALENLAALSLQSHITQNLPSQQDLKQKPSHVAKWIRKN